VKLTTKKILTVICALFLSVFMFAGCNLIEVNRAKYYSQVVVSVELLNGKDDDLADYVKKYTKKDLVTAFYNSGYYSYVQNGQIKVKEGVNYALNDMVKADLLYTYVKKNYFDNPNYDITFTDQDRNEVMLNVYDAIQEQITSYEKDIYEEWDYNYTDSDDLSDETIEPLRKAYEPYTSKLQLSTIGDKKEITLNPTELVRIYDSRVAGDHFVQQINDPEVSKEAYTRYIKTLQDAAKAEGKKTDEESVLNAEIERLKEAYTRSQYLTLFEDWYNIHSSFTLNTEVNLYVLNDDVKKAVVNYYKEKYIAQKGTYEEVLDGKNTGEEAYHTAMAGDSIDEIYYHYNSGNEYMYVSHILMKFSDAQKAKISEYKRQLDGHVITQKQYDEKVQDVANRTVVTYEIDGKTYTSTAVEVTEKIKSYVNQVQYEKKEGAEREEALTERAKRFNDMIYIYNDDDGIMNKDFAYVVNLDTEVTDKMVKAFADTARELNEEKGEGALSDMVITEYGVHILYHAGLVKNVVDDINTLTFEDLMTTKTQRSSNKTLFAKIYDTISTKAYSTASNGFVADCYKFVKVVRYENRYKDLWK